jgi:hypothetical protein
VAVELLQQRDHAIGDRGEHVAVGAGRVLDLAWAHNLIQRANDMTNRLNRTTLCKRLYGDGHDFK